MAARRREAQRVNQSKALKEAKGKCTIVTKRLSEKPGGCRRSLDFLF
jgi:hypothetical protein